MFHLWKSRKNCYSRLTGRTLETNGIGKDMTLTMAQVTSAIHLRRCQGKATTLRHLHKISELSQPEALNLIARMEKAGIVTVEQNIADAFESTIVLSNDALRLLERASLQEAA